MVDLETPPVRTVPDKTTRKAALWAAVVAVPVAVAAGLLVFWRLAPEGPPAAPPSASPTPVPSTAVSMAAPQLDARAARSCRAFTAQLPARVRDLPAREVSAGPRQNAAYGEPPITVSCGVPQPVMCERVDGGRAGCVPLDAVMWRMNGVCWYGQDGPATDLFTTMDRAVAVRVSVPGTYEKTAQWANEFSDAVGRAVPSRTEGVPTGCTQ